VTIMQGGAANQYSLSRPVDAAGSALHYRHRGGTNLSSNPVRPDLRHLPDLHNLPDLPDLQPSSNLCGTRHLWPHAMRTADLRFHAMPRANLLIYSMRPTDLRHLPWTPNLCAHLCAVASVTGCRFQTSV